MSATHMPRCEGLLNGPCPTSANNRTVRSTQGDLYLCGFCEETRFPSNSSCVKSTGKSKSNSAPKWMNQDSTNKTFCDDKCNIYNVELNDCCLHCDLCERSFHGACINVPDEPFEMLIKWSDEIGWVCKECRLDICHA